MEIYIHFLYNKFKKFKGVIMFLENRLSRWYKELPKNIKLAFVSTFILGLICHAYMMANKWVNLDDIVQLVDKMDRTTSGRWFLMFPSAIGSEFSLPWLNGLLTILYSAIMSSFIVAMFDIKSKISTILISGIIVTFPTIGSLMPFMNTQDSYQFGAMLAGIAAYLLVKKENGYIFSTILLTLSLGIYQTYLGYAAALVLIYIMLELFKKENNYKEMLILFAKTALTFVLSLIIYLIISRGIFGHLLVDYKGLDSMGSLPLNRLHTIIFGAYKGMYDFFAGYEFNYHFVFMPYLFLIGFLLTLYLIYYIAKKSDMEKHKINFLLFILLVFPLAVNMIYVMSWQAGVMLRMVYGYTVAFMLPLLLIDYIYKNFNNNPDLVEVTSKNSEHSIKKAKEKTPAKKNLVYYAVLFLTIVSTLSVYNNIYVTNKVYFKVGVTNQNSENYANRIISRIEMVDGYTDQTKVVFLGNPDSRTHFTQKYDPRDVQPFIIANHLTRLYSFKYYPSRFLGFNNVINDYDEITEDIEHLRNVIESMPVYPAHNSIQMIDDTIYVKFKDIQ